MSNHLNALRIAMWSGPRNISTAMMRAWENRDDTWVCDEPFYAYYLHETGRRHPGYQQVVDHGPTEAETVIEFVCGPVPEGCSIFYQKHMAHHLLPGMPTDWCEGFVNCFLIRDPAEMIPSLLKNVPDARIEDTALPQQWKLFEEVYARTGERPPVLDSRDVLRNPRRLLERLCESIGIAFNNNMLEWPAGSRETDGVWADFWYENVRKSTGFQPWRPKTEQVPREFQALLANCQLFYDRLYAHRIH